VNEAGGIPDYGKEFTGSGPVHGEVYYNLFKASAQGKWDVRFTRAGKILNQ
jgi:hypothetical protein